LAALNQARSLDKPLQKRGSMPKELRSKEAFEKLLDSATEVRVTRDGDDAKIKLRTKEALYTFKTTGAEADTLIKGLKAPVVEF
jgi:hypothetical protein